MTTPADLIQIQPPRPEPAAARKPVINDNPPANQKIDAPADKSFADHLDEQTQDQAPAAAKPTSAKPVAIKKPAAKGEVPVAKGEASTEDTAQADKPDAPDANTADAATVAQVAVQIPQSPTPQPKADLLADGAAQAIAKAASVVPAATAEVVAAATQPKAGKPAKAGAEKPEAKLETTAASAALAASQAAAATPAAQIAQNTAVAVAPPAKPAAKPAGEAVTDAAAAPLRADEAVTPLAPLTPSNAETQQADAAKQQVHPAAQNAQANPNQANAAHAQADAQAAVDAAKPDVKAAAVASTDATNALAAPAASRDATHTTPAQAALQSAPAATIQVATRFIERFDGRAQRFEVRLDPAELGRVDIRIEVGADKKVHAILAAHDSAALTDLMRGQRSLEQSLRDAGIDVAEGGIKFELSQDSGRGAASGQPQSDARANADLAHAWRGFSTVDVPVESTTAAETLRPFSSRSTRLDLVA